jgi:ubiquinone/menaquinone biosynthesis C-methylase UbiE
MTEVRHPLFARAWTRMAANESPQQTAHRRELLAGLRGRVLELGAGTGANFAHYPADVREVVAVEPESYLRVQARRAAESAPVPVTVVAGVADALPAEDGAFDAAVACLVLCTVPDQPRALAELRRVLRPGGELRFYEHVHARTQPGRAILEVLDRTLWPRIAGGCHPTRETASAIEAAGFTLGDVRRFGFGPMPLQPPIPHILGTARRA